MLTYQSRTGNSIWAPQISIVQQVTSTMFVPQRFVALSDGQQRRPKEEAKEGKEGHEGKEGKEGEEGGEAEGEELTNEDSAESFSFARMCAFSCEVMGQKTEGTEGSGVRVQSTWFWANYNDFTSLE